jgi:hypothetical protein
LISKRNGKHSNIFHKPCSEYSVYKQANFFYARIMILKKLHKLKTQFPFKTMYLLRVKGLTTSPYIVCDYTTSGHTDL